MPNSQNNNEQTALNQLMQALEQCLIIYEELIETADRKSKLIMEGQDQELSALIAREEELLERFSLADTARRRAIARWQQERGLEIDERASLTELRRLVEDEEERMSLGTVQSQLRERAQQLHDLNERNQLLLKQDAALTHDLLDGILGISESDHVYDHPKNSSTAVKRNSGIDYRM